MLKALELDGFKSFADKTRFEFPPGITVIVGPNGSGKSNIVDAIKWVLGEQSAKSLRGKEMADVIFKGSLSSGRKPMNSAEATLIFDNSERRLPVDAPEVHITRRIYRGGEGEYLINRQPARLKDIRDLFRGTGVGGDAYSLIEQGKVDRLLQASPRDRRAIFEEAAGISRFKAKKVETQRRLERVEQNLLRLADIVQEVETRLKTVRAQASKARRYHEYAQRLQALRTGIALVDWRRATQRLAQLQQEQQEVEAQIAAAEAAAMRLESLQAEQDALILTAGEELRGGQSALAHLRQQVAQEEAEIAHAQARVQELADELRLHAHSVLALSDKAHDLGSRVQAAQAALALAEQEAQAARDALADKEAAQHRARQRGEAARQQGELLRQQYMTRWQAAAALASQVDAGQQQLAALQAQRATRQEEYALAAAQGQRLVHELTACQQRHSRLAEEHRVLAGQIETLTQELTQSRRLLASRADDLAQLQQRQQAVFERVRMLEELEQTREGIGEGVQHLLARLSAGGPQAGEANEGGVVGPAGAAVVGLVADLLEVPLEYAQALDAALGEVASALVVADGWEALQALVQAADDLPGRLGAVGLSEAGPGEVAAAGWAPLELSAEMVAGLRVLGRADKLVACAPSAQGLVTRLLGRTFVVASLEDARQLRQRGPAGMRVVTLAGEVIEEAGVLRFGPVHWATSLLSRRSQLRAARLELAVLRQQIQDAQGQTDHLRTTVARQEQELASAREAAQRLAQEQAAVQTLMSSLTQQQAHAQAQQEALHAAVAAADAQCDEAASALQGLRQQWLQMQEEASAAQTALVAQQQQLDALEKEVQAAAAEVTAARVALVRCEQQVETLRQRLTQLQEDHHERQRTLQQAELRRQQALQRREAAELAILQATATIAARMLQMEATQHQVQAAVARQEAAQKQRAALAQQLQAQRRQMTVLREREHRLALARQELEHQRAHLAERMREDYQLDLAELAARQEVEDEGQRSAVEEEIELLRRKIHQLGPVNLEALQEVEELEQRYATLAAQQRDLVEAKEALVRIIQRINADSRRLFLETLEAIRQNFQTLYRKAFGGGRADLVLEEGVDVLEAGVEIIATPPGKPSFSNSLLSGGEKALTAVALLLAIFQFRPSPFCILDEVDAPFDEANIDRFVNVLREFLGWTRFVIVTHSKKTMTAATTLYGVTMQESGVSKRVSVRFDDVTEDGQIRPEALARTQVAAAGHAA
jgi:chromosome segregation protein